jgi:hypothetical protein
MTERLEVVSLTPRGKASLEGVPGNLTVLVPSVLAGPWTLPTDQVAEARWYSPAGAIFTTSGPVPSAPDLAPAEVDTCGSETHVHLFFTTPQPVPFKRGRTLWPRTVVAWRPPNPSSPRVWWPPKAVRAGMATSLALRADGDRVQLKRVLEAAGLTFTPYGRGPTV